MTNLHYDQLEDQWGRKIAARLSDSTKDLPHDITERLKLARVQALAKRKLLHLQMVAIVNASSTAGEASLHAENDAYIFWHRIILLLPLLALVAGLLTIAISAEDSRTNEIAEIDAELLTDELPPAAYTDPGFAQFLRLHHNQEGY